MLIGNLKGTVIYIIFFQPTPQKVKTIIIYNYLFFIMLPVKASVWARHIISAPAQIRFINKVNQINLFLS